MVLAGFLTGAGGIGGTANAPPAGNSDGPLHHSAADHNPHSDSNLHGNLYPWTPPVWSPLNPVLAGWADYTRHI